MKTYRIQYKLTPDSIEYFRYVKAHDEEQARLNIEFEDEITHNQIVFTKIDLIKD